MALVAGCAPIVQLRAMQAQRESTGPRLPASPRSFGAESAGTTSGEPPPPTVRPSRPTRLAIPAIGLRVGYDGQSAIATVLSRRADGAWTITPPEATWRDLVSVYWWSEQRYSALPGDPSMGTTFLYMHACRTVSCAGNDLKDLRRGDLIVLSTRTGTLRYTVTSKLRLDKTPRGVGNSRVLYSYRQPNQLRLVTCGYSPDGTSAFNWAIVAALTG